MRLAGKNIQVFKSGNEGDQNMPLQNTPLKDYFELKATDTQQM